MMSTLYDFTIIFSGYIIKRENILWTRIAAGRYQKYKILDRRSQVGGRRYIIVYSCDFRIETTTMLVDFGA